jgi:hypothetical protein
MRDFMPEFHKVAHPAVVANAAHGFNRDLRVVGYGYRPIRKSDVDWFSFGQSLVNPRGPQVLTATGLAVTKKANLFSQDDPSDENQNSFR